MEFLSIKDTTAISETNLFARAFRRCAHLIDLNRPFVIRGHVTNDHGCVTLKVTHVDTWLSHNVVTPLPLDT